MLVAALVVVLLLVGAGIWMMMFAFQKWKGSQERPGTSPPIKAILPAEPESPAPAVTAPGPRPPETPAPEAPTAQAEPSPEEAEESMEKVPGLAVDLDVKTTEPSGLVWPPLALSGVVGKGHNGAANINGQVVGIGETVDDVTVLAVARQGAKLEYKGETRFLKVGKSIE